jgi:methylphosphotriester-DNA--protein-cysteine methyltransferase
MPHLFAISATGRLAGERYTIEPEGHEWVAAGHPARDAEGLLGTRDLPLDEVASLVGFQSRTTLFRHMKRALGAAPSELRSAHERFAGR